jgi:tetratricopeptide (TPR) repeat protein
LGNLYKEIGQKENAIKEFEIAIKMDKYFFFAYNNLAALYFEQKDYNNAILTLEKILEIQPGNEEIFNLILQIKNERLLSK